MSRRPAFALPAVLALIVLVVPVVFALALRSHQQLEWYVKLEDRKRAQLMAEEGEAAARAALAVGGAAVSGERRVPTGGMEWRLVPLAAGDAGQRQAALIAEGVNLGEERLLVAFVEVFGTAPGALVLEHDRAFVLPGPGGGSLLTPTALVAAQRAAVQQYVANLAAENQTSSAQFESRLRNQAEALTCPDIAAEWSAISAALLEAKCSVQ